ncbi:hypothetical protein MSBR3_0371 [Methanosarcina barkeri 3]|uniref:DUF86 domain-containing protein n=1 Tax=Methanosarcina barkeri 3 TaxID=1434107 RepID=A0A0E3SF92_METBA|nr:HepT-like ribonuclease domain-containing protein [Methanosarcina barkeri]AKB80949.1 hypothetical protein MSBR3_0371 [Methanosarcina barkeri 3]
MRQEIIDKLELLEEYITETFARKIEPAAGFRNVLVHMYAKVELDRLYENLQKGTEDMELFAEYIAQFLAKKNI